MDAHDWSIFPHDNYNNYNHDAALEQLDAINRVQEEYRKLLSEGRAEMRSHHSEQKSYFSRIRVDMIDIANQSAEAITKIQELKHAVESGFDDVFAVVAALLREVWDIQGIFYYSIMTVRIRALTHSIDRDREI